MRKLVQTMQARIEGFLAQRKNLLLVVRAADAEYLPLASVLAGIESAGSPHDFLLFSEPFENPENYAAALVESLATRYAAIAPALQKEGLEVPSGLPADLRDPHVPPIDRLRGLFVFERGLIADLESAQVVVGLLPSRIADPTAFARLVMALVAHDLPIPWCHHMRFVVREDATQALLSQHARTLFRADFYAPDFGQDAVAKALEAEALDENEQLPVRMQALLLSAGMDYAHGRLPAAGEKYALLSRYHATLGPPVMLALSLNGFGEVFARIGKPVEAQRHFESALTPAIESRSVPVLINIALNLANLHRLQGRWKDAFEHYEAVSGLAKLQVSAPLQLRCLEQMGFCKYKLKDTKAAWEYWNAGVALARGVEAREDLLDCLQRIRNLYRELGMAAREREAAAEVAVLERQGIRPFPA
jgi:tetratricopeptide (TPR) repeat protein